MFWWTLQTYFPVRDNKSSLYCIVLYCIVLYCIVLYCIVLYCIVLYCIVLYCIVLYCIVLYCIVLYCITLHLLTNKRSEIGFAAVYRSCAQVQVTVVTVATAPLLRFQVIFLVQFSEELRMVGEHVSGGSVFIDDEWIPVIITAVLKGTVINNTCCSSLYM